MTVKSVFNPKVSIVIPVYNGSNYMREAIDSALAQTYENIEVIVVNDGSNDNDKTRDIALSYGDKIRYFEKENGGVASALNLGIEKMTGEYFSWLSHDDVYYPKKIESQIQYLRDCVSNDNVAVFSDFNLINERGVHIHTVNLSESDYKNFQLWLTKESALNGCTLLVPKDCFIKCGNFDTDLVTTQDYDLWFRIAEYYSFARVPKVLIKSRQHELQGTRLIQNKVEEECNEMVFKFFYKLKLKNVGFQNCVALATSFYKRHYYSAAYKAFDQLIKDTYQKKGFFEQVKLHYYRLISNILRRQ
jgi:glycosyltransferase involved in cell wall biosynthesis